MKRIYISIFIILIVIVGCGKETESKNLTEKEVIRTLEDNGLSLEKIQLDISDDWVIDGITPSTYVFENNTTDYLFLYVFDTLGDREKALMDDENEQRLQDINSINDIWNSLDTAKNVLLLYTPGEQEIEKYIERSQKLSKIAFEDLNEVKTIHFEGEGEHWKVTFQVKYYEHFIQGDNSNLDYDSYSKKTGQITYKHEDIENVGEFEYQYETRVSGGSGTGVQLNEDGSTTIGVRGGNGALIKEDDTITFTIQWNGKSEEIVLTTP